MAEIIKKAGRFAQANDTVYNITSGFLKHSGLDIQDIIAKASVSEKE